MPTDAFAELEALRTAKQRDLSQPVGPATAVPAVALQQFLVLLQSKKFEKAKALAFRILTDDPNNETVLRSIPLIDMQLKLKEGRPPEAEDADEDGDDDDDDDDDSDDSDDDDDDDDGGEEDEESGVQDQQTENEPPVANGNGAAVAMPAAACDTAEPAAAAAEEQLASLQLASPMRQPAPTNKELTASLRNLVDSLVEEDSTQAMR